MTHLGKLAATCAAFLATPALADAPEGWNGGYGHMMGGGYSGFFGGLFMLVLLGAVIFAAIMAARWMTEREGGGRKPGGRDALDILRERLAKGDIDPEEFEARRKVLEGS